jgi:hypothetical protein
VKTNSEVLGAERRSFSIDEFCERNGISRRLAYNEIKAGRLKIRKAGVRSLVTIEAENDWLASLPYAS